LGAQVLQCYVCCLGRFDAPRLVTLDDLILPAKGLAYVEDAIAAPMLAAFEAGRAPYLAALRGCWEHGWYQPLPDTRKGLEPLLATQIPLKETIPDEERLDPLIRLLGTLFSIRAEAAGTPRIYVTPQPNVKAMLNTVLGREDMMQYAHLIEMVLSLEPKQAFNRVSGQS
jgi:hypothetical protein